ncbi:MAG: UDP-N-acetylmuramate dehydrogenase [Candidatus Paceibacteria bacterium]
MEFLHTIQKSVPLASHTTLGVGGPAKLLLEVKSVDELQGAITYAKSQGESWVVLGGGSNVLVPDSGYDGLVIKMSIDGMTEINKDEQSVVVQVGAGVYFDTFVRQTVEKGWWGMENLSFIPGTVGATPVQNVGAYGAEISQTVVSIDAYDTSIDEFVTLTNAQCTFGYRTSVFKAKPQRYIITSVTFSLSLLPNPKCTYADLVRYFADNPAPSLSSIRQAVIEIRSQKFPDWEVVGTAGSFFKNPIVPKDEAETLLKKYPELPNYEESGGMVKLSLGYILDKVCGLKGYKEGKVGLYDKQALVLVVEKNSSASEVIEFSEMIQKKVFLETGITIEREVTLL